MRKSVPNETCDEGVPLVIDIPIHIETPAVSDNVVRASAGARRRK